MEIRDINEEQKEYISVQLYYTPKGEINILAIEWKDGREFKVENQKEPIKTGYIHIPEIYPVLIKGSWRLIFYQDPQFFVLHPEIDYRK